MAFSQRNRKVKHRFSQVSHTQACLLRAPCFFGEMLSISVIAALFHTDLTSYVATSLAVCRATTTLHLSPNGYSVRSHNSLFLQSLGGWWYPVYFYELPISVHLPSGIFLASSCIYHPSLSCKCSPRIPQTILLVDIYVRKVFSHLSVPIISFTSSKLDSG